MVTIETKGPNGNDGDQRAQWLTIETKGPNVHDGLMFLINLVPNKT